MEGMNWLKTIENRKSGKIAKEVFLTYTTQEKVSSKFYPDRKKFDKGRKYKIVEKNGRKEKVALKNTQYVEPIVNRNFKIWEKEGFLTESRPLTIYHKNRWGGEQPKTIHWRIMNLNPIFKYCREIKNISFTEEEKYYLENFLLPMREKIIKENPEENLIMAVLKFYSSNFPIRYLLALRQVRDLPRKYSKERKKAKELNDPKNEMGKIAKQLKRDISKKYGQKIKDKKWDEMKVWAHDSKNIHNLFVHYFSKLEQNPKIVESVDRKILKALSIYPNIDIN
jgi:hypothetical protein